MLEQIMFFVNVFLHNSDVPKTEKRYISSYPHTTKRLYIKKQ